MLDQEIAGIENRHRFSKSMCISQSYRMLDREIFYSFGNGNPNLFDKKFRQIGIGGADMTPNILAPAAADFTTVIEV